MLRRWAAGVLAGSASAAVVVVVACTGNGIVTYQQQLDAAVFSDHAFPPSNVGGPCGEDRTCRQGLACGGDGTCAPAGTTATGGACVIGAECVAGDYCGGERTCTPAGTGAGGSSCASDADCAAGLRCDVVGLVAECQPSGTVDVGGTCQSNADCYSGLDCSASVCVAPPSTTGGPPPLAVVAWPGAACADDPPPVKSYFQVPRGTGDGGAGDDFFRLPFPNDARRTSGHPDLTGFPTPGSALLGYDLVGRYVSYVESTTDGFSTYPTVTIRFSGGLDFATLSKGGALQLLELGASGSLPIGFTWTMTTGRNAYVCPNALSARPQQGQPLKPGTTYAFIVGANVTASDGSPLTPDADLQALLGASPPADAALGAAYTAYAPLRAWVSANGGPSAIAAATLFTTGHPTALAQSTVAAVTAAPAPTVTGWVNCSTGGTSPCPQAQGDRACGTPDPGFFELHALATLPIVQSGTEPYADPTQGGDVAVDSSGNVQVTRTEQVCLALTVPKGTMPTGGWPLVVYAHGTGGSFRSHILEGVSGSLAAATSSAGVKTPIAVLGIDQVEHGTRRGSSTASPDDLFYDFGNPGAARGNPMQGAADQASLLRLVTGMTIDASVTGSALKFGAVAFWGHSQGATEGAISLPYVTGYSGVVLSGEGASLIDALLTKKNPVNIAAAVPAAIEDPGVSSYHPVLALLQSALDSVDPLNHAAALAFAPLKAGQAKNVLQPYGLGDTYAPPATEATFAIAAHLGVASPPAEVTTPDPIGGVAPTTVPASGNITDGTRKVSAFVREYLPGSYDGHFVAFQNATAQTDVATFLADAVSGKVPSVGH